MKIGLVDCNNFFVSCERLFRPDLKNQPTLVLSANDGCVVARSQEVKDIGIPMGVPYFKIKDIIKDNTINVFSGNIVLYRDVSRRVFDIVRQVFSTVEQYSIDEAFFTGSAEEVSEQQLQILKDRVWREIGIPISIGLAESKTLAKVATDLAKQGNGVCVLDRPEWNELAKTTSLGSVWGIGRGLADQYRKEGLYTVADLLAIEPSLLRQRFGVVAARQQSELFGQAVYMLSNERPLQQSLMSSRSFCRTVTNKDVLIDAAAYHVRHIAADLRAMNAVAGAIRVSLRTNRHGDFFLQSGSQEVVLEQGSNETVVLLQTVTDMIDNVYATGVPYQKVGVTVSRIAPLASVQQTLFSKQTDVKENHDLYAAIDALNSRSPKELVTIGSRLREKVWQPKAQARSAAYTTRWNEVCEVSARMPHS